MNPFSSKNPETQGSTSSTEVDFNEIMQVAMMNYKTGGLKEAVSETLEYAADQSSGGEQ